MAKRLATAPFNARYVLFTLMVVHVNNMWARYLPVYLYAVSDEAYDDDDSKNYVSMADATGITTSEYGIIVGYGFSVCFVVFSLVMGRAADVYNRKLIIFYGMVIWNVATVFLGLSDNYAELLQSRLILGIGESFSMPASFSLIADYFPVESLAQANGVYISGIYVGGGLSSLSIAMAEAIGWRNTSYAVAAFGFLVALAVRVSVQEPPRIAAAARIAVADSIEKGGQGVQHPDGDHTFTVSESLRLIFGDPLLALMIFGGMIRLMGAYAMVSYLPDFYSQVYPEYNTMYSYLNATVVSVGGALSSYLGGCAADRWEKAGEKRARLYVPAIGALLGVPAFFMVIVIPSFYASMFFLFVEFLFSECWYAPLISVLQKFLPPRARGVGVGCYSFCIIVAGSFMTYVTGVILDAYTSDEAIKRALIVGVCGMYLLSAITWMVAARFMPDVGPPPIISGSEKQPLLTKDYEEPGAGTCEANLRQNDHRAARSRNNARDTML